MLNIFGKIFKSSNQRRVDAYQKIVNKINAHEEKSSSMSEDDFKNLSISENPTEQEIIEVFSAVREAAKRTIGLRHFDCQLICLLYTSPSPRDLSTSRIPSSA